MRLIDADKFKQEIVATTIKYNLVTGKGNAMCELIDRQPTAYDADKVVERIEKRIEEIKSTSYYPHNFTGQMVEDLEWVLSLLN